MGAFLLGGDPDDCRGVFLIGDDGAEVMELMLNDS